MKHDKTGVSCRLGDFTRYVSVCELLHTVNVQSSWQNFENKNLEKIFSAQIQKWNFKKQKFKIYFINFLGRKCERMSSNLTINSSVLDVFDYCWFIFFHLSSLTIFDISTQVKEGNRIRYGFCRIPFFRNPVRISSKFDGTRWNTGRICSDFIAVR